MTALEYMEKQLAKNKRNYEREQKRGVPDKMLHDIEDPLSPDTEKKYKPVK